MSASSFAPARKLLSASEGGYVNHPRDPGGATNKGVIQRVYDAYRKVKGLPQQSVQHITDAESDDIYRRQYWNAVHGDELPAGVDYAVFDYAVNSGAARAAKALQRALLVDDDGKIGLITLAASGALKPSEIPVLIDCIMDERLAFLKELDTWDAFGRGWASRVASVRKDAKAMAALAAA